MHCVVHQRVEVLVDRPSSPGRSLVGTLGFQHVGHLCRSRTLAPCRADVNGLEQVVWPLAELTAEAVPAARTLTSDVNAQRRARRAYH